MKGTYHSGFRGEMEYPRGESGKREAKCESARKEMEISRRFSPGKNGNVLFVQQKIRETDKMRRIGLALEHTGKPPTDFLHRESEAGDL